MPRAEHPKEIPSSSLSWIGDAVFELRVRERILRGQSKANSGPLHRQGVHYSRAVWQAQAADFLEPYLTEEELWVYRRGRNHAPRSVAKHAPPQAYRKASGFEALIGYLYLIGANSRINEILDLLWHLDEGQASAAREGLGALSE